VTGLGNKLLRITKFWTWNRPLASTQIPRNQLTSWQHGGNGQATTDPSACSFSFDGQDKGMPPNPDERNKRRICYHADCGCQDLHPHLHGRSRRQTFGRVTAESVFEAGALALAAISRSAWLDTPGRASRLEVVVSEPSWSTRSPWQQVERGWNGATSSPNEKVRKEKLKTMLSA